MLLSVMFAYLSICNKGIVLKIGQDALAVICKLESYPKHLTQCETGCYNLGRIKIIIYF